LGLVKKKGAKEEGSPYQNLRTSSQIAKRSRGVTKRREKKPHYEEEDRVKFANPPQTRCTGRGKRERWGDWIPGKKTGRNVGGRAEKTLMN